MNLTPSTTIERGDAVTRQTLFDLVSLALGSTVGESDLSPTLRSIVSQSLAPLAPAPGLLWWDQTEQLMKLFIDVVDGTACSNWCAIGPDRFDVPLLADEPIPFGAAVQLSGRGRAAKLPPDALTLDSLGQGYRSWEAARVVGFNNNGAKADHSTAASGTWFAAAVDGIPWTWFPIDKQLGVDWLASKGDGNMDSLLFGTVATLTGPSTMSGVRGALGPSPTADVQAQGEGYLCLSTFRVVAIHNVDNWARRPFCGPRLMKNTAG